MELLSCSAAAASSSGAAAAPSKRVAAAELRPSAEKSQYCGRAFTREEEQAYAEIMRSVNRMTSGLTREVWVLRYCKRRLHRLEMLMHVLIATIPVLSGCTLNFAHPHLPVGSRIEHMLLAFFTTCHLTVVQLYVKLKLAERIHDMNRIEQVSGLILNRLEFARHKPLEALEKLIEDVETQLEHSKLGQQADDPPEWAYKLFDQMQDAGKLRKPPQQA